MEHLKKYWWIYGLLLIVVILIIFLATSKKGSRGGNGDGDTSGDTGGDVDTSNGGTGGTPQQTLHQYTCETRKVCQGRGGFANWVKTGTQKKCNASNLSQLACINDCKGTCFTWE